MEKIMDDKEVGEIWKKLREDCVREDACDNHSETFRLIRKLVDERSNHYFTKRLKWWPLGTIEMALRDFGIPQEEWDINSRVEHE